MAPLVNGVMVSSRWCAGRSSSICSVFTLLQWLNVSDMDCLPRTLAWRVHMCTCFQSLHNNPNNGRTAMAVGKLIYYNSRSAAFSTIFADGPHLSTMFADGPYMGSSRPWTSSSGSVWRDLNGGGGGGGGGGGYGGG